MLAQLGVRTAAGIPLSPAAPAAGQSTPPMDPTQAFKQALSAQQATKQHPSNYVQIDTGNKLARDGPDKLKIYLDVAKNGSIFIDEAYQLNGPAGQSVMDDLLAALENQRHELTVIFAGYKKEMEDFINGGNIGLASRLPGDLRLQFDDFDESIIRELLEKNVEKCKLKFAADDSFGSSSLNEKSSTGLVALARRIAQGCGKTGFANARTVRNQWDAVLKRMSTRVSEAQRKGGQKLSSDFDIELVLEDFLGKEPNPARDPSLLKLHKMTGLRSAKATITKIATQLSINYAEEVRGQIPKPFSLNCIFAGNAGTGKTTAAELFADFLVSVGMATGFDKITPSAFMDETAGRTRTALGKVLNSAALTGRVLFIDEAHQMFETLDQGSMSSGVPVLKDGSRAAFETLVSSIPGDGSSTFILILAGYTDKLRDMLNHPKVDQGFRRRVPNWVEFDDFSNEELRLLLKQTAMSHPFHLTLDFATADQVVTQRLARLRASAGFGNAGTVRELVSTAASLQQSRIFDMEKATSQALADGVRRRLMPSDFELNKADTSNMSVEEKAEFAFRGLSHCGSLIDQFKRIARNAASILEARKAENKPLDSYLFLGPPGTGKTTIASRFAQFLHSLDILPTDTCEIVNGIDLTAAYVGQSKERVNDAFNKVRLGGVLFIDEAYELMPTDSYKVEVLGQICGNMTQPQYKDVVLIMAGYEKDMTALLKVANIGLRSRFEGHVINFEAWGVETSNSFIIDQLKCKKKWLSEKGIARLEALLREFIDLQGQNWASCRNCNTICSLISENYDNRHGEFKSEAPRRREEGKRQALNEQQMDDKEDLLEKEFYHMAKVEGKDIQFGLIKVPKTKSMQV